MKSSSHHPRHAAFTLVEMTVALAVTALLTVALGAALSAASRIAPDDAAKPNVRTAAQVIERLCAELTFAETFTVLDTHQVNFVVADRNGDGEQEQVMIAWGGGSGKPGDPLTITFNKGDPVTLANPDECSLAYVASTVTETVDSGTLATGTTHLRVGSSGAVATPLSGVLSVGQSFVPSLPGGTTAWSISRIVVVLAQSGATDGSVTLAIQAIDEEGDPTGADLDRFTIDESALQGKPSAVEWSLATPLSFAPGQGACILVRHTSGVSSAQCLVREGAPAKMAAYLFSVDGGSTFKSDSGSALSCEVVGTVTAPSATTVTRTYLDNVNVRLRLGVGTASSAAAAVRILNRPEIAP